MAEASDLLSKIGELLVPWGGLAVTAGAGVGTVAAADASLPKTESRYDPGCGNPADLGCYSHSVSPGEPRSVMGDWVPSWWVGMDAAAAGFTAAVLVLGLLCFVALAQRASQQPPGPGG